MDPETSETHIGRPPAEVDEKTLLGLCQLGCTMEEMAHVLGVHERTLQRRFAAVIKRGRATGAVTLRREQWHKAMKGDTVMLIWLGKQMLGQVNTPRGSGTNTDALTSLFESFQESVDKLQLEGITLEGSFGSGAPSPAPPPMTSDAG